MKKETLLIVIGKQNPFSCFISEGLMRLFLSHLHNTETYFTVGIRSKNKLSKGNFQRQKDLFST